MKSGGKNPVARFSFGICRENRLLLGTKRSRGFLKSVERFFARRVPVKCGAGRNKDAAAPGDR
mgnify:CR=1 FL=1